MADNNFRPFRSRDSLAREDVDPTSDAARDPLAELARIIGQSDRVNQFDRAPRHDVAETLGEPLPATADRDWAADDGYAEPDAPEQYPDQYAEENYVQPRLPDPYPADRAFGRYDRNEERAPSIASQYSEPAEPYDDPHDEERAYDTRYRDEDPPRSAARQPALAPQSYDDEYEAEDQWDGQADRQSDDVEDYDDEATSRPRRSGLVVVLAMLGLVMIGAGGAFAYRAMFGGAILAPSLPPVIKANDAPNKIVPNRSDAQAAASNPAGAQLRGRRKNWYRARNSRSRSSRPTRRRASFRQFRSRRRPVLHRPAHPPPLRLRRPQPRRSRRLCQRSSRRRNRWPGQASPRRFTPSPFARTRSATRMPRPRRPGRLPSPRHPRPALKRPKRLPGRRHPRPAVTRRSPSCRSHKAQRRPPSRRAPAWRGPKRPAPRSQQHRRAAAGGYAVQVTSQRCEADAQTEFKALQAKFPSQLGNRQPIIHRADLGRKRHLLPRPGRPLRLLGGGRGHVQQFESRRRQLHRPEELAAARLTLAFGAG